MATHFTKKSPNFVVNLQSTQAMAQANNSFLRQKGNYKALLVYKKAECIYDLTYHFVHRFLSHSDRTTDQMIQAARSGKQNIAEGSAAATTSTEAELKLTNVAKASLQELLADYEDYLRVRGLQQWQEGGENYQRIRQLCTTHNNSDYYRSIADSLSDETIANIVITLIHQADFLLYRLLQRQQSQFVSNGGIREQMYNARKQKL